MALTVPALRVGMVSAGIGTPWFQVLDFLACQKEFAQAPMDGAYSRQLSPTSLLSSIATIYGRWPNRFDEFYYP
jgi:hypothetical protein